MISSDKYDVIPIVNFNDEIFDVLFKYFTNRINQETSINKIDNLNINKNEIIKCYLFLLNGEFNNAKNILDSYEKNKKMKYSKENISFFRLKASIYIYCNDSETAKTILKKILNQHKDLPKWYINSIITDLNNINNLIFNSECKNEVILNEYKKEFNELKDYDYNLIIDSKLVNLFDEFENSNLNRMLKNDNAIISWVNHEYKLKDLLKVILLTYNYGFFSQMKINKLKAGKLLYSLYYFENQDYFLFKAIEIFISENEENLVKNVLDKNIEKITNILKNSVVEIINYTLINGYNFKAKNMYALLTKYFNDYINDEEIVNIYSNIVSFLTEDYDLNIYIHPKIRNLKVNCINAIKKIISRINETKELEKMVNILSTDKMITEEIVKIFVAYNSWEMIDNILCKQLIETLIGLEKEGIISNPYYINIFIDIYRAKKKLRNYLDTIVINSYETFSDRLLYYFAYDKHKISSNKLKEIFNNIISIFDKDIQETKRISFGGMIPQYLFNNYFINYNEHFSDELVNIIIPKYKSLLLDKQQFPRRKQHCLESICFFITELNMKTNLFNWIFEYSNDIIITNQSNKEKKDLIDYSLGHTILIKTLLIRLKAIIYNKIDKNDFNFLIQNIYNSEKKISISILESIPNIINYSDVKTDLMLILYNLTFNSTDIEKKSRSILFLSFIKKIDNNFQELLLLRIKDMINEKNDLVKLYLLESIKNFLKVFNKENKIKLKDILSKVELNNFSLKNKLNSLL